jgi:molybdenum cofactor cytidylyltransferase
MSEANCAAIVLAAGASTRLGQPKQLLQWNGETLLHRAARLAIEAGCAPVFIVLGFEAERMQHELSGLDAKPIINPDWQSGMGSSLRCGIQALRQITVVPERVLLLLSDQPHLSLEVLQALLKKNREENSLITASAYADNLGVPAIFRKPVYPALQNIEGDKGARHVIQQYRDQTTSIDFPSGAIDIDTAEDLEAMRTIYPE